MGSDPALKHAQGVHELDRRCSILTISDVALSARPILRTDPVHLTHLPTARRVIHFSALKWIMKAAIIVVSLAGAVLLADAPAFAGRLLSPDYTKIAACSKNYDKLFIRDVDGEQWEKMDDTLHNAAPPWQNAYPYRGRKWSPDGSKVAWAIFEFSEDDEDSEDHEDVVEGRRLFVVDVYNKESRRLTPPSIHTAKRFRWCPDGRKIAFIGKSQDTRALSIVDSNGENLRTLNLSDVDVRSQKWSRDGSMIFFLGKSTVADGRFGLYVVDADFQQVSRRLASLDLDFVALRWSPDGSKIAFLGKSPAATHPNLLSVVDSTNQNLRQIPTSDLRFCIGNVRWSPDGSKIAFSSRRNPLGSDDVWVVGEDCQNLLRVYETTPGIKYLSDPKWSPDGSRLALYAQESITVHAGDWQWYTRRAADKGTRVVVSADGQNVWTTDVRGWRFDSEDVFWLPNGHEDAKTIWVDNSLIYRQPNVATNIVVANSDLRNARRLTKIVDTFNGGILAKGKRSVLDEEAVQLQEVSVELRARSMPFLNTLRCVDKACMSAAGEIALQDRTNLAKIDAATSETTGVFFVQLVKTLGGDSGALALGGDSGALIGERIARFDLPYDRYIARLALNSLNRYIRDTLSRERREILELKLLLAQRHKLISELEQQNQVLKQREIELQRKQQLFEQQKIEQRPLMRQKLEQAPGGRLEPEVPEVTHDVSEVPVKAAAVDNAGNDAVGDDHPQVEDPERMEGDEPSSSELSPVEASPTSQKRLLGEEENSSSKRTRL